MAFGIPRIEKGPILLAGVLTMGALLVWLSVKMKVYGDIDWGDDEVELEKAYVCDMQCVGAGYEEGTEEYFACIERCYAGN